MATLKVVIDGDTVWSLEADYESFKQFPSEYLARPGEDSTVVHELWLDDTCIGMQRSLSAEALLYELEAGKATDDEVAAQLYAHAAQCRVDSIRRIKEGW